MLRGLSRRGKSPSKGQAQEDHGGGGFELRVRVLRARDLRAADARSKSSDPFVKVRVGKKSSTTKVVTKSLAPKWDEEFVFGKPRKGTLGRGLAGDEMVLFHVQDKDMVFNDDLGAAAISLEEVLAAPDRTLQRWLELEAHADALQAFRASNPTKAQKSGTPKRKKKGAEHLGELLVHFHLSPVASKPGKLSEDESEGAAAAAAAAAAEEARAGSSADESGAASPGPSERPEQEHPPEKSPVSPLSEATDGEDGSHGVAASPPQRRGSAASTGSAAAQSRRGSTSSQGSRRGSVTPSDSKLVVRVLECRRLRAADSGGTSDPYCSVRFGKQKQHTETIKRSLDPRWDDATFAFNVLGKNGRPLQDDLVVRVFDDDMISDDLLGHVKIPFATLRAMSSGKPEWFELQGSSAGSKMKKMAKIKAKKAKDRGAVRLAIAYPEALGKDHGSPASPKSPLSHGRGAGMFTRRQRSPKSPSSGGSTTPRSPSPGGTEGCASVRAVELTLVRARGLRNADAGGKSDPYCVLRVGKEKHKSKTIRNDLDPEWNETYLFEASRGNKLSGDTKVELVLYDADILTSDRLGFVRLTVDELRAKAASADADGLVWLELLQPHKAGWRGKGRRPKASAVELGSVAIKATVVTAPETDAAALQPAIKLYVREASGLRAADRDGLSDPYCVIRYPKRGGKTATLRTNVVKNTLEPKWTKGSFDLADVDLGGDGATGPGFLTIKVMDKDLLTSQLLGKLRIELSKLVQLSGPQWLPLEPSGKLCLEIEAVSAEGEAALSSARHKPAASGEEVLLHLQKQLAKREGSLEQLRNAFSLYDQDNSGTIDREELKKLLEFFQLCNGLSGADLDLVMDALDANKDGKVIFAELEMLLAADDLGSPRPQPSVAQVLQGMLDSAVAARAGSGDSRPEAVDGFVSDLKRNLELFDTNGSGIVPMDARFDRVLSVAKTAPLDAVSRQVLLEAFPVPDSAESINYLALCEHILELDTGDENVDGTLELALPTDIANAPTGLPDEAAGKDAYVYIKLCRAEGLRAADTGGSSDPFVTLTLGRESKKSKVIKKTCEPVWDQEFELGKKAHLRENDQVVVTVKDRDVLFSDFLGTAQLPLRTLQHNNRAEMWVDLVGGSGKTKARGRLLLVASLELANQREHNDGQVQRTERSEMSNGTSNSSSGDDGASDRGRERKVAMRKIPPIQTVDAMEYESPGIFSPDSPYSVGSYGSALSEPGSPSESRKWHDQQLRDIRSAVAKAIRANGGRSTLRNELEKLDVRHKGYLSSKRLVAGLAAFGVHLAPQQFGALLPRVDPEGLDRINYDLLCRILRSDDFAASASQQSKGLSVETLRARVNRVILRASAKNLRFGALFQAFDGNASGIVTDRECCNVLRALDGTFEPKEIMLLAQHTPGAEQGGYIRYRNLVKGVCPGLDLSKVFDAAAGPAAGATNQTVHTVLEKFKRTLRALRQGEPGNSLDPGKAFEECDRDGDGSISKAEFRAFIEQKVNRDPRLLRTDVLSEHEIQALLHRFDVQSDGRIDYAEFLRMISPSRDELERAVERLRKRLHAKNRQHKQERGTSLLSELSKHDRDGKGELSRHAFRAALHALGEGDTLSTEELRYLMDKFDPLATGSVQYHDFIAFVHGEPALSGLSAGQIGPEDVDRVLRGELSADARLGIARVPKASAPGGCLDMALGAVRKVEAAEEVSEQHDRPVDLWHPQTIGEWLNRHASPGERSDFDEIYRAVAEHASLGRSKAALSDTSDSEGRLEVSSAFGDNYWGNVNAQKLALDETVRKKERKKERKARRREKSRQRRHKHKHSKGRRKSRSKSKSRKHSKRRSRSRNRSKSAIRNPICIA